MQALLNRVHGLGIRHVTFEFDLRFNTVRTQGPNIARERRRRFPYVICLWDHRGSGQEHKPASQVQGKVQAHLNGNTLKGCSKAIVIDPELEIWLWQDWTAIAVALKVEEKQLAKWLKNYQQRQFPTHSVQELVQRFPQEALEAVVQQAGEKPDSALYGRIADAANFELWSKEPSFRQLRRTLRRWFPQRRESEGE